MMQVAPHQPDPPKADTFGQVLTFPDRRPARPPFAEVTAASAASEAAAHDPRAGDDADQNAPTLYRHRLLMNLLAAVVVAFLIGAGLWIADILSGPDKDQDCVLQGHVICPPDDAAKPDRN